jgi:hypothetical protein
MAPEESILTVQLFSARLSEMAPIVASRKSFIKIGVRFQVSGVSKQTTEEKNSLPFSCCHLFSVCCPLHLPDT